MRKVTTYRLLLSTALLLISLLFLTLGYSSASSGATPQRITFVAAGDAMAHMAVIRCAKRNDRGAQNHDGFDYIFEYLKPYIMAADISTVNAEFPVSKRLRARRVQMVFNAPPGMVGALAWTGFKVANVANNHSFDQGVPAVADTVEAFEQAGIKTVGAGRNADEAEQIVVIERNGIKVAFLGASRILSLRGNSKDSTKPRVNYFRVEQMEEWIRKSSAMADVVIVNVHWSREGQREWGSVEKRDAVRMMDAGADVIVGHHPHVLQPIMAYTAPDGRRCVAAMSLGNLVSNQRPGYRYSTGTNPYGVSRDGALLRATFEKRENRVMLAAWDAVPLWTWNDRFNPDNRVRYPWSIQVWPIPTALERIDAELKNQNISNAKRRYLTAMRNDLAIRSQNILKHLNAPLATAVSRNN